MFGVTIGLEVDFHKEDLKKVAFPSLEKYQRAQSRSMPQIKPLNQKIIKIPGCSRAVLRCQCSYGALEVEDSK